MKILVLSSYTPSLFWFRIDMMKEFAARGHEVVAAAPGSVEEWNERGAELPVRYRQIVASRNGVNPLTDLRTLLSCLRLLREERPDKIFVYQAKTICYGCMAARILGITEVYPLVAGMGSIFEGSGMKRRLVRKVMTTLYKSAFSHSRRIFFQNNDDIQGFLGMKLLDASKVVRLNGSGVNTQTFRPAPSPTRLSFLFIGRLLRDKGVGEYLEACRRMKALHPEVRCLLVGPFDTNPSSLTEKDLNAYVQDGTIEYFGEQRDVRPFIEQCSVYVLPSYREGTPKTVLEAMAMGRPIITTDAPGCRETVKDGKNGFLVKVKDVDDIVEKMCRFHQSPALIPVMGQESTAIVQKTFDTQLVNADICTTMNV